MISQKNKKKKLIETGYNQTKKYLDDKINSIKENETSNENNTNSSFDINNLDKYDLEKEIQLLLDDLESGNF